MRENWRETLPDPATSPERTQRINRAYVEDRQRQRARRQAERMKKALDETDRRDKKIAEIFKTVAAILVIFLVFGALAAATITLSGTQKKAAAEEQEAAVKEQEATTENAWDGSQAGANAVTVEDLKAEYETDGWQRVGDYSLRWDIRSTNDDVTIAGASDGPIYDLPLGWTSFACHDRTMNRSYTVIVSDVGTFAVIPTLDENGEQVLTEQY